MSRTFESGAVRDTLEGKLQYEGYLNPLVLHRFATYMLHHQTLKDGSTRAADNWQKNLPCDVLMDSLLRHVMDVWLYHRGYTAEPVEELEDSLCGILFNTQALLKIMIEARRGSP